MWISRKKYKELINENCCLRKVKDDFRASINYLSKESKRLIEYNENLRKELEQLKVEYSNEVNKNFELSSYLSKNKNN